jgi:glycyl-tRNA synthetase alpha chain
MEVSAVHLFPAGRRLDVRPVAGELTYGLERLAMYVFGVDRVYDLPFNDPDSPLGR